METRTIYATPNTPQNGEKEQVVAAPNKGKSKTQVTTKARKGDSFGMAMLRVLVVLVIMAILYFAWTAYRVQHGDRY